MDATPRTAIFDLDRTVTRRGSYTPFLLHCAQAMGRSRLGSLAVALPALAAYGGREAVGPGQDLGAGSAGDGVLSIRALRRAGRQSSGVT